MRQAHFFIRFHPYRCERPRLYRWFFIISLISISLHSPLMENMVCTQHNEDMLREHKAAAYYPGWREKIERLQKPVCHNHKILLAVKFLWF